MLRAPAIRNRNVRRAAATVSVGWLLAYAGIQAASARTLELRADALHSAVATARRVHATLDWPDGKPAGMLRIDADEIAASDYGYRFTRVHWECPLLRDADGGWRCTGDVRAGGGKPMRLAIAIAPAMTTARVSSAGSAVGLERNAASPDTTRLLFEHVPVAWLQAYTATLWSSARLQKGTLGGRIDIRVPARGPVLVQGPLAVRDLALETPDGTIAAGALDADVQLDVRQAGVQRSVGADLVFHGGELLAGGFYATLPKTDVAASVRATRSGSADWLLPALHWNDGGVLAANGTARFSPALDVRALDLQLRSTDLATARGRYLTGWLGPSGFGDLQLRGGVDARLVMDAAGMHAASATFAGVDAVDGKQRFALRGVDGDLRWTAAAEPVAGTLRWHDGAVFGIALGPSHLALRSQARALRLDGTADVPVLGGTLRVDQLAYAAPSSGSSRFVIGMTLRQLQVAQLAKALGWPAFGGTLDGTLPAARYENEILSFDGGLSAQIFGGKLAIGKLTMERPFGVAPTLGADIAIDDFDLKALTGVFGFGEITGRLDGHILDLRLLDWSPVAFDAELHSDDKAPDRRRISQRAITDLSNVGGGGFVGGLQAQALKIFQDFGYARLGIGCKLANNVCHMTGVGSAGAGYTIVEGSGLPHIAVVGFERQVDWPTLVTRLKAATEGKIIIK